MARECIPALAIAVVTGNRLRWERAYGTADLENFVPATPAAVFRLASVTKPLTATAVMQLAERGKLDLDAPIQRYVPEFPAKRYPLTVRQLLWHAGGVRHYRGDEFHSTRQYDSLALALDIFKRDSLVHAPGATITYSSYGYVLLGVAVERASGMRFADYLRAHVFEPAGMPDTRQEEVRAIIPHRVEGYSLSSSGELRNAGLVNLSSRVPAGGIVSTAGDMARFAAALQTGRLVRPETFARMISPNRTNDGVEHPMGYGFALGMVPRARPGLAWHGGNQQGSTTLLYMQPREQYALVILTNLEAVGQALVGAAVDITGIVLPERR